MSKSTASLEEKIAHQLAHPLISEKMVNVVAPFQETTETTDAKLKVGVMKGVLNMILDIKMIHVS